MGEDSVEGNWRMKPLSLTNFSQWIEMLEEKLLAFSILAIAIVTILNVGSRTLFNRSLTFAEELSQFFILFVTFIGLGYAASKGRHIRMSALYDQLGRRMRKFLMSVICGATSVLMWFLAYYSLRYILTVWELGSVSPVLRVPFCLIYVVAPLGFVLAGVQYALALVRNILEPDIYLSYDVKDEYQDLTAHL